MRLFLLLAITACSPIRFPSTCLNKGYCPLFTKDFGVELCQFGYTTKGSPYLYNIFYGYVY